MKPKPKLKAKAKAKTKHKPKPRFNELEFLRDQNRRARAQMERSDPANALMIFGPPLSHEEQAKGESPQAQPGQVHNIEQTRDLEGEAKAKEGADE
jgi:hypothetical protein